MSFVLELSLVFIEILHLFFLLLYNSTFLRVSTFLNLLFLRLLNRPLMHSSLLLHHLRLIHPDCAHSRLFLVVPNLPDRSGWAIGVDFFPKRVQLALGIGNERSKQRVIRSHIDRFHAMATLRAWLWPRLLIHRESISHASSSPTLSASHPTVGKALRSLRSSF